MSSRVTITDLARELSLSVCTINKALTGKPNISAATRQRVLDVARKMGYQPNALARSMGRPVLRLAALYPAVWPSHNQALFDGVRERMAELRDHRIEMLCKVIPGTKQDSAFPQAINAAVRDGARGLIFSMGSCRPAHQASIRKALAALDIPQISLGAAVEPAEHLLCCVWQNCRMCGQLAGEALAFAGSTAAKTAIFIGDRTHCADHQLKIAGFAQALRAAGRAEPLVGETFDDPAQAYPAAQRLFREHPEVAGVYIGTENGEGILRYLSESGRAGKVRVVATGISSPVEQGMRDGAVHLTIHQRQRSQGRLAVDLLFAFLENGVRPEREILVPPHVLLPGNFAAAE